MNYRKQIGSRISAIRVEKGLTQLELAELAGMKQPSIARVEAGRFDTKIDTIGKIADLLDCRIDIVRK